MRLWWRFVDQAWGGWRLATRYEKRPELPLQIVEIQRGHHGLWTIPTTRYFGLQYVFTNACTNAVSRRQCLFRKPIDMRWMASACNIMPSCSSFQELSFICMGGWEVGCLWLLEDGVATNFGGFGCRAHCCGVASWTLLGVVLGLAFFVHCSAFLYHFGFLRWPCLFRCTPCSIVPLSSLPFRSGLGVATCSSANPTSHLGWEVQLASKIPPTPEGVRASASLRLDDTGLRAGWAETIRYWLRFLEGHNSKPWPSTPVIFSKSFKVIYVYLVLQGPRMWHHAQSFPTPPLPGSMS